MNSMRQLKSNYWFNIRRSRKNTIYVILICGITLYLILVLIFALLYYLTNSISATNGVLIRFYDAFYFSFVSFITIGFGDIFPISDIGKLILFLETICSVLFNGIFPSILIYFTLKRPDTILLTSKILVNKNTTGKYIFNIRIGNIGDDLTNITVVFKVFSFTKEGVRTKYFLKKKTYAMIEHNTVSGCSISLENPLNEKLLLRIQSLLSNSNEKFILRVNLIGTDSETGDNVTMVKYYNHNDILFGHNFQLVSIWIDGNMSKPKWNNFDKTIIKEQNQLEDFLKYKIEQQAELQK